MKRRPRSLPTWLRVLLILGVLMMVVVGASELASGELGNSLGSLLIGGCSVSILMLDRAGRSHRQQTPERSQ